MPQRGISALGSFLLAAALRRVANCEVVEGCNRKLNHLKWQAVSTSWRLGWIDLH
jgi:precorrin-6B methylase 1